MSDPTLTRHVRYRLRVKSLARNSRLINRRSDDIVTLSASPEPRPTRSARPFVVVARYLGKTAVVQSFGDRPSAAVLEGQLRNRYRCTRAAFTVAPAGPIAASVSWKLLKRVLADALA